MLLARKYNFDVRVLLVVLALIIAIFIYHFEIDKMIIKQINFFGIYGSLIIGGFYTFGLTTPTAMLILVEMMKLNDPMIVILFASFSAACVDTFFFIKLKEQLEKNTKELLTKIRKRIEKINFIFPIIGFFVLGSPLPDEIGLALMEITEIKSINIFLIVFLAKTITLILMFNAIQLI